MIHALTVSVDWNKDKNDYEIRYSNGTGNLTVRGTGDRPQPRIRFDLHTEGWTFTKIAFHTQKGIHVQPDGSEVFERLTILPSRTIDLVDRLSLQDVGSVHRYKYTLVLKKIGDDPTERLTSDPEIQNEREPRLGGG